MLAQHFIDLDHGGNGRVLLDVADPDGGFGIAGIGFRQLAAAGAINRIAEGRVGGNAAAEGLRPAVLVLWKLTDEFDFDDAQFLFFGKDRLREVEEEIMRQQKQDPKP